MLWILNSEKPGDAEERKIMNKKTMRISLGFDPAIENPKLVSQTKIQNRKTVSWSRREFLKTAALAASGALFGSPSDSPAAEPPPETTTIKLAQVPALCTAPQIVAEESLRSEGFTDIQYVKIKPGSASVYKAVASGEAQLGMGVTLSFIMEVDAGATILLLTGVHVGCYELFGVGRVRSVHDLKGKRVSVPSLGSGAHALLASMAAYVGLDPRKDINWVTRPFADSMRLLAEEKIDAFMGFPPEPQELRAKKIGRVIVNTVTDRPWSQYFCCSIAGNQEFVRKHPAATKRAVRAILKGNNICASEPDRVARLLTDRGYATQLDYALQTVKEIPYGKWREYDSEDTVRFYALRLHEAGMIKSSPQKIISQGTEWRFLRELKKELKA
jgi:NitT/TauT family transport system substrate-binding protein